MSASRRIQTISKLAFMAVVIAWGVFSTTVQADPYIPWQMENFAIKEPLGGLKGDAERGKQISIAPDKGGCLNCHAMPFPEEPFHGDIGPSLLGVASRLTEGELRLRVVDEKQINPDTIMPGYYRHPKYFTLVAEDYEGKTFLTAQ